MNSSGTDLRTEFVALDTNEYLLALGRDERFPACAELLFEQIHALRLHMPLQVLKELSRQLRRREIGRLFDALEVAAEFRPDYTAGDAQRVVYWEGRGAKKGDAVITTQLEAAGVRYFVSENRHFLAEITDLPFEVLSAEGLLLRIAAE